MFFVIGCLIDKKADNTTGSNIVPVLSCALLSSIMRCRGTHVNSLRACHDSYSAVEPGTDPMAYGGVI